MVGGTGGRTLDIRPQKHTPQTAAKQKPAAETFEANGCSDCTAIASEACQGPRVRPAGREAAGSHHERR